MNRHSLLAGFWIVLLLWSWSATVHAEDSIVSKLDAGASFAAATQQSASVPVKDLAAPVTDIQERADMRTHEFRMHQESNKVYEILILSALALISLFVALRYLAAHTENSGPHIVNATGLVCIIFGTILLVLMAQSDQQLTASVGILGAVAGYLFRSIHSSDPTRDTAPSDVPASGGTGS